MDLNVDVASIVDLEPEFKFSGPGVGTAKAPYIPLEITPAAAEYMKAIKRSLDPNNILNPGKIFLD